MPNMESFGIHFELWVSVVAVYIVRPTLFVWVWIRYDDWLFLFTRGSREGCNGELNVYTCPLPVWNASHYRYL